jgi:carboxyl-terminal processing protease
VVFAPRRPPNRPRTAWIALGAVAAVGLLLLGVVIGGHPAATGLDRLPSGVQELLLGSSGRTTSDEVLDILEQRYYRDVDPARLKRTSVDALVRSLDDPYTQYLDRSQLTDLRNANDGLYYGVGLQVAVHGERVIVTGAFPGSPAARAGIRGGELLVSVDGRLVRGDVDAAVGRIKGPVGTTVKLGIRGPGRRRDRVLSLERAKIQVPPVVSRALSRDGRRIGYVRLIQFTRGAGTDLRAAVDRLVRGGAGALVLDLRGDPGGLVDEAVGAASVFLPKGAPVVTTEGAHEQRKTLRARGGETAGSMPLVLLVDRNTASASEILAGALRDDGRGTLVGTRTFGKALVQTTVPLSDGGALKLTTARYLTPKGHDIGHRGLQPSVRVRDRPETPRVDEALQRALALAAAARTR